MFGFKLKEENNTKQKEKIKAISTKKKIAAYSPNWHEVWEIGYTPPNGKFKKGIFQYNNTPKDVERLQQVKLAIENGVLPSGVDNLKRFNKTHALRLFLMLEEQNKDKYIQDIVENCPDNYELITTSEHLNEFVNILKMEEFISVDTETTGLRYFHDDRICGICFGAEKANRFAYLPFAHTTGEIQLEEKEVVEKVKPILENATIKKIFHNFKFDGHMLYNSLNIDVKGLFWDTLSAQTLLFEQEESYALKNLLTKYKEELGLVDDSRTYESLFGKGGFQNTFLNVARFYGSHDVKGTLLLFRWQQGFFKRMPQLQKLLHELEIPQLEVSLQMERNGMLVNLAFAREYTKQLKKEIEELGKNLIDEFEDINWNSPLQIQKLLYEKMHLKPIDDKKSTDAKTLKKLVKQEPKLQMVLDYREKNKLLTTYYEPLPKMISRDGRIHANFHPHSTKTGRYSSSNCNLQNIAPNARPMFIPEKGNIIIGIDFNQIEPKYTAYASNCPNMQRPYLEGWDFYSSIASKLFKVPIEECGDGSIHRKRAKVAVLAASYGIHEVSLAESMGITIEEAVQMMEDFYTSNPEMAAYKQATFKEIDEKGFTTTWRGRKRRFPGHIQMAATLKELQAKYEKKIGEPLPAFIWECKKLNYKEKKLYWDLNKEVQRNYRMAFNFRIQGSCAEGMKQALLNLHCYCLENPEIKLIATIHDEVLLEAPETITQEQVEHLECLMCSSMDLKPVPVTVDVEFYRSWGNGISKDEWFAS